MVARRSVRNMSNPASLLLAQFHAWNKPNKPAAGARGTDNPTSDAWVQHRLAVRHLNAIDEILSEMAAQGKNVAVYQAAFVQWTQVVFAFPRGWGEANSGRIDGTTLQHLETLAGRLEDYLPTTTDDGLERTRTLVDQVRNAIISDDSLPQDLKVHLHQMADQLGWCLDHYEITGDFELKNAIDRLFITIGVTAQVSKEGGMWAKFVNTFVYPFITSTSAQLTGRSILMLTTGTS